MRDKTGVTSSVTQAVTRRVTPTKKNWFGVMLSHSPSRRIAVTRAGVLCPWKLCGPSLAIGDIAVAAIFEHCAVLRRRWG
jgi:hypothetical protein